MAENTINIYSTRAMMDFIKFEPGVARFFRETAFRRAETYNTNIFDIDVISQGRPIAVSVKRREDGNLVEDKSFETKSVEPGYLNEFKAIEIDKFKNRKPQETPYNYTGPGVQAQQAEAESFTELTSRFNRSEELFCIEAMTNGTFTGKNKEGVAIYQIDFKLRADHKPVLSGANLWDDPGMSKNKLLEMIRGWITHHLIKHGGKMPTHMALGGNAFNAFLKHVDPDDKTSGHNAFTVVRGVVTPRMQEMGVFFLGTFPELGNIQVVGYNEWYDDPWTKETKPVFPSNKAVLFSKNARYVRLYGRINHLEAPDFAERFPYIWSTPNGKQRHAQLESAPLMAPLEIDTVFSATVTAA